MNLIILGLKEDFGSVGKKCTVKYYHLSERLILKIDL